MNRWVYGRVVVPLTWSAEPAPQAYPTFTGTVELEPESSDRAQLVLVGCYQPPVGPLGVLVDATLLHGVAARTIDNLVDGLACALTGPHTTPVPLDPVTMRVRDVMNAGPMVLQHDMPLRTAAALLLHHGYAAARSSMPPAILSACSARPTCWSKRPPGGKASGAELGGPPTCAPPTPSHWPAPGRHWSRIPKAPCMTPRARCSIAAWRVSS